jgi:alcohol dehydrogenase
MPTEICFGRGSIDKNKDKMTKLGKKALIVTGKGSSKRNGSLNDMENALKSLNIEYIIFDEVEENPSLETIEKAALIGKENKVNFVVGIGGGSPLDASKAVSLFIKNPKLNVSNAFTSKKLPSIPVVAVPTTSGTGSEVTQYSIVTVHAEKTKKNLGQSVFPAIAFVDSSYTDDTPYEVTVNTAVDAFTHLAESYLNTNSTIMSEMYAEKGFRLFKYCFKKLIEQDLNEKFREKVMLASMLGGIAIAHTGTSLPHGMGYALTYYKNLPHGVANGILTVEYLKIFKNKEKINKMLKLLDMDSLDDLEKVLDKLIKVDITVSDSEILEYAEKLTENKAKLKNHPEEVDTKDIEKIYRKSLLSNN